MAEGESRKKSRNVSDKPAAWPDVLRIIQSAPCNELQLQRIGTVCLVDADTQMLEMSNGLTLTGECWGRKFGCTVEVESAADFFSRRSNSLTAVLPSNETKTAGTPSSPESDEPALCVPPAPNLPKAYGIRHDFIHWTLAEPLARPDIIGAAQRIRAALNVNGCLVLTIPVRVGVKDSPSVAEFYSTLTDAPLMQPQEVSSALEEGGFEPLAVEFSPNRQALARYKMIISTLSRIPNVQHREIDRWSRESKLFLKEGGVSFFPTAIFVARRWEYVDGS